MKLTEEAKIWIKQEELRFKSCVLNIGRYNKQYKELTELISLEERQKEIIQKGIDRFKKEWKDAKSDK